MVNEDIAVLGSACVVTDRDQEPETMPKSCDPSEQAVPTGRYVRAS